MTTPKDKFKLQKRSTPLSPPDNSMLELEPYGLPANADEEMKREQEYNVIGFSRVRESLQNVPRLTEEFPQAEQLAMSILNAELADYFRENNGHYLDPALRRYIIAGASIAYQYWLSTPHSQAGTVRLTKRQMDVLLKLPDGKLLPFLRVFRAEIPNPPDRPLKNFKQHMAAWKDEGFDSLFGGLDEEGVNAVFQALFPPSDKDDSKT
jgi:hypothetical protein